LFVASLARLRFEFGNQYIANFTNKTIDRFATLNKIINKTVCEIGNKVGAFGVWEGERVLTEVVSELYMKIGVYGGSFDPVTWGHLWVARMVLERGGMDEVWFMPSYRSLYKDLSDTEDRLEMLRLAISESGLDKEKVKLERFNVDNKIVQTSDYFIKRFEETFNDGNEYYFIIGMDNALAINTWILYPKVLDLLKFIVIERVGYECENCEEQWFCKEPHIFVRNTLKERISSGLFKELYRKGEDVSRIIPDSVLNYIKNNNLMGIAFSAIQYKKNVDNNKND